MKDQHRVGQLHGNRSIQSEKSCVCVCARALPLPPPSSSRSVSLSPPSLSPPSLSRSHKFLLTLHCCIRISLRGRQGIRGGDSSRVVRCCRWGRELGSPCRTTRLEQRKKDMLVNSFSLSPSLPLSRSLSPSRLSLALSLSLSLSRSLSLALSLSCVCVHIFIYTHTSLSPPYLALTSFF